ncbi:MAG: peptidylprolyl isomerase [Parcubacteria group bacterium Gr01-1014_19]|nr:MAG: peptidylprolyl isomerase [Parcubacteria group bacterium Gr01-1014_19]
MLYKILAGLVLAVVVVVGVYLVAADVAGESKENLSENSMENNLPKYDFPNAVIETSIGAVVVKLYPEDAPKTVENFKKLAGEQYYDGLTFHRVIPGFMVQGGDPNCTSERSKGSCGSGGPGYKFADELNPNTASAKEGYKKGVLAMANAGPNTNGSQFFIMVADVPLPHNYTIFGKVVSGQEIADKISMVKTGMNDRPVEAVVINKITAQ